jgi:hypothetical protein
VSAMLTERLKEIVAEETRLAFREHETELTAIIQGAVKQAFADMLSAR